MARKLRYNDEEGGMVKAQLQKIEMYAAKLNEMIHPDDEIEAWVQSKLSVVAAYMGDVKHYLDYELKQQFGEGGSMPSKPRHWEVEFTWEEADDESRKVYVVADSVAEAEEQVRKKFAPYYKGFRVVEVEEDKEMTWDEYAEMRKGKKMADGGVMKYEGSTMAEDMEEAKDYIGVEKWNALSREDKVNATQYLKLKGLIGYYGQEEDVADFMASQYRSGGSIYRGMRPSPSVSATVYPEGYKMVGNDGDMWKIAINSKGIHRWVKVSGASYEDKMEQQVKIRKAIELLEDMRDTVDVEDEIESLKKQLR